MRGLSWETSFSSLGLNLSMDSEGAEGRRYFQKILELIDKHHRLFKSVIPLIASENIPSPAVREALTCDFGNRYAEGWPGERLYAGCRYIDEVEKIAIELAKKVYEAEFADCLLYTSPSPRD